MISLDKFINKYVGKSVGVPWNKALDGECVSMVQRYINECHNQPLKVRGHAIAFGDTLVRDRVAKVVAKPQYGDIIVWGKNMGGGYGHVAIYLNEKSLFDQNNSSVKPTRTSQVRPMIKTKPIQYIRMNNKLVVDSKKDLSKVAQDVIDGKYGTGTDRQVRLRIDGYDYKEVQAEVNRILYQPNAPKPKSVDELAKEVIDGKHGTGAQRKKSLGNQYNEVQKRVNQLLYSPKPIKPKLTINQVAREVINGKWGNGQDRTNRLTKAGYNPKQVQAEVNRIL